MAGESGSSMGDLRARSAVSTLHRANGAAQEIDPLTQVINDRRKLQAMKVMDAGIAEQDTAVLRAENERLQAKIDHEQLLEATQKRNAPDEWREYMLHQLEAMATKLDEAQAGRAAADQMLLQERLSILQGELTRLQSQPSGSPFDIVTTAIDQAEQLVKRIRPEPAEAKPPGLGPALDTSFEKWKLTVELQREERRIEAEEKRAERESELTLRREKQAEEIRIAQQRADLENRFLTDTAPKILDLVQRLVAAWTARAESPSVLAPAAEVAPTSAVGQAAFPATARPMAAVRPNLPPGVEAMPCGQCGALLVYRPEFGGVICHNCGAEYVSDRSQRPPPSEASVEESEHDAASEAGDQPEAEQG